MIILLLITSIPVLLAGELTCGQRFPIRESVDILGKLITKHAVPVIKKDENGIEWMNYLFVKHEGLLVNGVRYFLNDDRFPPEMTFSFDDSLQLDPVPIFVVEREQLSGWRPDVPNKTYALTKISHRCEADQTVCGLRCCYSEMDFVQKGFTQLIDDGNLLSTLNYTLSGTVYSLRDNESSPSSTCSYSLSHHDILSRKAEITGQQISAIYFSCPESFNCCGLTCLAPLETAQLRKSREVRWEDRRRTNVLLSFGAVLALIGFVVITFINYRNASVSVRQHHQLYYEGMKRHSHRTVDTQTSRFSLHDDNQDIQDVQKLLASENVV